MQIVQFRYAPDGQSGSVIECDTIPELNPNGVYVIRGKKTILSYTVWGDGSQFYVVTGENKRAEVEDDDEDEE